ncbi:MAG: hypothetical protein LBE38_03505 [Deltaproteobacteria bacterium]|jgi:homocitrate synthase NifV|nr:hypothetical protein [Deltaproteobacteria bacterium]
MESNINVLKLDPQSPKGEPPLLLDGSLPLYQKINPREVNKNSELWQWLMGRLGVTSARGDLLDRKLDGSLSGFDDALFFNYQRLFKDLRDLEPSEIIFGNKYHCATALAAAWLEEGGHGVICSFGGIGGLPVLEELKMMLHALGRLPLQGGEEFSKLKALATLFTGSKIDSFKPVIGEAIFAVESGIHVDGILKDPYLYEPFAPELVGCKRFLATGYFSGKSSLRLKAKRLGLELTETLMCRLLKMVKEKALELERGLTDDELLVLANML